MTTALGLVCVCRGVGTPAERTWGRGWGSHTAVGMEGAPHWDKGWGVECRIQVFSKDDIQAEIGCGSLPYDSVHFWIKKQNLSSVSVRVCGPQP